MDFNYLIFINNYYKLYKTIIFYNDCNKTNKLRKEIENEAKQ